jgi:hypothetical protein
MSEVTWKKWWLVCVHQFFTTEQKCQKRHEKIGELYLFFTGTEKTINTSISIVHKIRKIEQTNLHFRQKDMPSRFVTGTHQEGITTLCLGGLLLS